MLLPLLVQLYQAMSKHIVIDARIRTASTGKPVQKLLENLQKIDKKNTYTILLSPGDEWRPSSKKWGVVKCRFKQFSFNPINQILFSWQLYRLKPDLVHFTLTGQQPIFYFGRQITFTHDLTMLNFARRGRLPAWLHMLRMYGYKFLLWQSHRKAKTIIVPTEYVALDVKKYHIFVGRKVTVTLEASDPPIKAAAKKPQIDNIDDFILYVGTAFPHKNLRRLIKGFQLVREKNPDLKLVMAGKREQHSKKLEKWATKNDLVDGIIFTGYVEDVELKWLYENAEMYVFPSLSEGFGLPGLEAMAHGCPVISSEATCLPEVYGDAALYFDPLDKEAIAKTISRVLSNEAARKELIKKGHKQVATYSWGKMASQTLEIYTSTFDQ